VNAVKQLSGANAQIVYSLSTKVKKFDLNTAEKEVGRLIINHIIMNKKELYRKTLTTLKVIKRLYGKTFNILIIAICLFMPNKALHS